MQVIPPAAGEICTAHICVAHLVNCTAHMGSAVLYVPKPELVSASDAYSSPVSVSCCRYRALSVPPRLKAPCTPAKSRNTDEGLPSEVTAEAAADDAERGGDILAAAGPSVAPLVVGGATAGPIQSTSLMKAACSRSSPPPAARETLTCCIRSGGRYLRGIERGR